MARRLAFAALALLALHQAWDWQAHQPLARPPGVLAAEPPRQRMLAEAPSIAVDDFKCSPWPNSSSMRAC